MPTTETESEICDCGLPLHYTSSLLEDAVKLQVNRLGRCVNVVLEDGGVYRVPRHYIALHGIRGEDVSLLAAVFGWERAT